MTANRQTILIGILAALGLVGVFFWFGGSLPFVPAPAGSEISAEYAGVVAEVARLKAITLDTDVVTGNAFKRLVTPALPPYPNVKPGGRNPYLPF